MIVSHTAGFFMGGAADPPLPITLNPLDKSAGATLDGTLLKLSVSSNIGHQGARVTRALSGKFYCRARMAVGNGNSRGSLGIGNASTALSFFQATPSINHLDFNGQIYADGSSVAAGGGWAPGSGYWSEMCMDTTAQLLWMKTPAASGWNNSGLADPALGIGGLTTSNVTGPIFIMCSASYFDSLTTIELDVTGGTAPTGFIKAGLL